MEVNNNFFAILTNGEIRKIKLAKDIISKVQDIFINYKYLLQDNFEEIEFDGNYSVLDKEEEVLYVQFNLPENVLKAPDDPLGQIDLNLTKDSIKALFWCENSTYYFQSFDKRKLLRNKNVFVYDRDTFNQLQQDAFILDEVVTAIFKNGRFYFRSYTNANKIFSLIDFFQEATNEVVTNFSNGTNVIVDRGWLLKNANTLIRKHITFVQNSGVLASADIGKIQRSAKKFKLAIELEDGKIKFPNNVKDCKDILFYLNEHYYVGLITRKKYRTNSKKQVDKGN
jgi:hypothetical protein